MRRFEVVLVLCGLVGLIACSSDAPRSALPYDPNSTAVIGGDYDNPDGLTLRVLETPDGDECIDLDGACVRPQEECGDSGAADVLLDDSGNVVDVICYPTSGVAIEKLEGEVDHVGNNVVLVFDDEDDGADVTGDVTIDGNNVTLYGNGPDTSVIGGDLNIDKNNAVVRGIRIQGDVTITKNNPSIVDCVIEGDLTIHGNNVSIALCDIWGKLVIEGNNTVLVNNRVATPPEVHGNNTVCASNVTFTDVDDDGVVSEDELGETVVCAGKSENK
jgi:hypothetical protein